MAIRNGTGTPVFRKSTYSSEQDCVEVALNTPEVLVRDTKDRQAATLAITRPAWASFMAGCREGAFDC